MAHSKRLSVLPLLALLVAASFLVQTGANKYREKYLKYPLDFCFPKTASSCALAYESCSSDGDCCNRASLHCVEFAPGSEEGQCRPTFRGMAKRRMEK